MTAIQIPVGPWSVRPGWGISVNLTPPQLANARRVRTVRKLVVTGLGLIVLACGAGYFLAGRDQASARDALAEQQVQTMQLNSQLAKYDTTVRLQSTVAAVRQQISTAMAGDVSTDDLLARVRAALPGDMTIQQVSVTVSLASATAATPDGTDGTGLNDAGHARIGDVTISGTSHDLGDLSEFVEHLQLESGIVDVIPTSNAAGPDGVQYSLTFGFTDQLRTHAYDLAQGANK
jgi:type IV pilus assembly protein PilN